MVQFSPDVTAAMLVHRTIEKKVSWEFDSIIIQNMSHNLLTPTWPSYHVIENQQTNAKCPSKIPVYIYQSVYASVIPVSCSEHVNQRLRLK